MGTNPTKISCFFLMYHYLSKILKRLVLNSKIGKKMFMDGKFGNLLLDGKLITRGILNEEKVLDHFLSNFKRFIKIFIHRALNNKN